MEMKMTIKEIKKMPDGTNVACEGIVISCKPTRTHQNQWKQNVQITDDPNAQYPPKIWIGLTLQANTPITNGTIIKVEEGILGSFDTGFQNKGRNIDVRLYTIPSATEPPAGSPREYQPQNKQPDWDEINLGKCRHTLYCAAVQAGMNPVDLVTDVAMLQAIEKLAGLSMNGLGGLPNPDYVGGEEEPPF
jgi:hypothetical protein